MGNVYKIYFADESELDVSDAEVDEENRVVRVLSKEGRTTGGYKYDYYPFEQIKAIIFLYIE